jgi:hypothetical protein
MPADSSTKLDFEAFAQQIYDERPASTPRFLWPALYGGEPGATYDAMFVFIEPLNREGVWQER